MVAANPVLHVRFDGRSLDIPLNDLDLGNSSSDTQVRESVSEYLNVQTNRLRYYVIDRHETGNMTLRPEAVYG